MRQSQSRSSRFRFCTFFVAHGAPAEQAFCAGGFLPSRWPRCGGLSASISSVNTAPMFCSTPNRSRQQRHQPPSSKFYVALLIGFPDYQVERIQPDSHSLSAQCQSWQPRLLLELESRAWLGVTSPSERSSSQVSCSVLPQLVAPSVASSAIQQLLNTGTCLMALSTHFEMFINFRPSSLFPLLSE